MVVDGPEVRSRLISPREAARLMGLPETYRLPERYNDAYHLLGDGVVVPVVAHLQTYLLTPILMANQNAVGTADDQRRQA
jgi:DNA (cytosine-5)-methyltransferase 1